MLRKLKLALVLLLVVSTALSLNACSILAPVISPPTQQAGLATIEQAWNLILNDYVDKSKIDTTKLSRAAIKAIVETLNDPYTSYLDPDTYKLTLTGMEGRFEGIGATVGVEDKKIKVIAPIPGSPAEKAGIKAGDTLLEIDGRSTKDMSLTEAVLYVRGPKGTTVRLLIQHEGENNPQEVSVVREEIQVPNIHHEMKRDIAYISIAQFSETTDADLIPVLTSLAKAGATGIILDLRGNPGGFVQAVVDVASHFLKAGEVVTDLVDNRGNRSTAKAVATKVTTDLPVVVLVDKSSVSGSEVLAGALKDYGRATIAGIKTFGKGSVNVLRQFKDGSGMYITTGRWLTPKGNLIEGKGIEPDYALDLKGDDLINWAIDFLHGKSIKSGGAVEHLLSLPVSP